MRYIDPHIHLVSRTTDDYQKLAMCGCCAVSEPAFWAGFDRSSPNGFYDYFTQLTDIEPKRAAQYGIKHHCWLCINPKEAEEAPFAEEVVDLLPEFLDKPTVLGIGEIGLNKNTKPEMRLFEKQAQMAIDRDLLILVHTPHLEDKLKGTKLILDMLRNLGASADKVLVDHVEEHTAGLVLDAGYWAGMTLYPDTKCTPQRACDILEMFGTERLCINSACDWGPSDAMNVPRALLELKARGHASETVDRVGFQNPNHFLSQSGKFDANA